MRHRRSRKLFGFIPRVNPDLSHGQIMVRGIGLALVAVGVNKTLDTTVDPFLSTDRSRSLWKTGIAAVLGLLISRRMPFLGTGFIAAGALELFQLGYREMGLDRYEAMARDRVAAIAARMRTPAAAQPPAAPPGTPPTSGLYDLNGARRGTGALGDGRGVARGAVDPAAIRNLMNAQTR